MTEGLHVVSGQPDDEELAAVVMALAVIAARPEVVEPAPASKWKASLRARPETTRSWRSRG